MNTQNEISVTIIDKKEIIAKVNTIKSLFIRRYQRIYMLFLYVYVIFLGIVVSCDKSDLDLKDDNIYKWEVTIKRIPLIKDVETGGPAIEAGQVYIEVQREIKWLTNRQVHEMLQQAKSARYIQLEFRRLE